MPASTVLMIRPLTFCANVETAESNSFQRSSQGIPATEIISRAQGEFDHFQELLEANGIHVIRYDEAPGADTPDACFPNNWFCQLPDGRVFIFPMQALNRRREVREDILRGLKKTDLIDLTSFTEQNLFLEGTGSLILDHQNHLAYACLSPRTSEQVLAEFSQQSGYKVISFSSFDEKGSRIYHTNVMMALGDASVVINLSSIPSPEERKILLRSFETSGKKVIDITHTQMNSFAGNMLYLGNERGERFWVMSTRAWSVLTNEQRKILEEEGKLIHSPVPTIEDFGGGGVRCLMAEIFVTA